MAVVIPGEVLKSAQMSEAELTQEIALMLFQKEKLTLAQASRLAGMPRIQFQHLLASRQIPRYIAKYNLIYLRQFHQPLLVTIG